MNEIVIEPMRAQEINVMAELCHAISKKAGWYTDLATGKTLEPSVELSAMKLVLIHSEVTEAWEGARKDLMDDHLPHRKMEEVELADVLIRVFDYAGFMGYDLGGAMIEKMKYNQNREDHKIENRLAKGGKKA